MALYAFKNILVICYTHIYTVYPSNPGTEVSTYTTEYSVRIPQLA